jgi:hypothetical protein
VIRSRGDQHRMRSVRLMRRRRGALGLWAALAVIVVAAGCAGESSGGEVGDGRSGSPEWQHAQDVAALVSSLQDERVASSPDVEVLNRLSCRPEVSLVDARRSSDASLEAIRAWDDDLGAELTGLVETAREVREGSSPVESPGDDDETATGAASAGDESYTAAISRGLDAYDQVYERAEDREERVVHAMGSAALRALEATQVIGVTMSGGLAHSDPSWISRIAVGLVELDMAMSELSHFGETNGDLVAVSEAATLAGAFDEAGLSDGITRNLETGGSVESRESTVADTAAFLDGHLCGYIERFVLP